MFFKSPTICGVIYFFVGLLLLFSSCMTSLVNSENGATIFPHLDFASKSDLSSSAISSFQIAHIDNFIEIKVQTVQENCIGGFELERAIEGMVFEKITREEAIGDSVGTDYLIVDDVIFWNKKVQYRLKILNKDGTYEYSEEMIIVMEKLLEKVSLISNPVQSKRYLEIASLINSEGKMKVFNAKGEQILSKKVNLKVGKNWSAIELENAKNGVYFVDFQIGEKHWTRKLIKFS